MFRVKGLRVPKPAIAKAAKSSQSTTMIVTKDSQAAKQERDKSTLTTMPGFQGSQFSGYRIYG